MYLFYLLFFIIYSSIYIQGVNDIDCQKNMGDTSQSTYQKCIIQFCFISYFNFYVLKPDVFSTGTVRMSIIHQLCGSSQLGNTRVKKRKEQQVYRRRSLTFTSCDMQYEDINK